MIDYKILLGYLAVLIVIISYVVYFKQIIKNNIKPHAFSWFIWSLSTGTVFVAQIVEGGGAGAWATGGTMLASFAIFFLALYKGDRKFLKFDWLFLSLALVALLLWWLTKGPTLSVILITIVDVLGVSLTFNKGYYKPFEESITLFSLSAAKWLIAIFALSAYTVATALYPATLIVTNVLVTVMLLIRRKNTKSKFI